MDYSDEQMILQTRKWVKDVVVGTNFCPFAAKEVKAETILYKVAVPGTRKASVKALLLECVYLDEHPEFETTLLLYPTRYEIFADYLDLIDDAEQMVMDMGYEGIYQLASFHPLYVFEGSDANDAANYTNRSIYPMIHILRESSIERALEHYPNPEGIPARNVNFARTKGLAYMKLLREQCK